MSIVRFRHLVLRKVHKTNNTTMFLLSFFMVILTGAILLSQPFSSATGESVGFLDALFTSTSAVCVTGLVTLPTFSTWTLFGKIIIILLIQIGGLGFMTLMMFTLLIAGKNINLKERVFIQQAFNQVKLNGMVVFLKYAIFGTFLVEGVGAIILFIRFLFKPNTNVITALGYGIFHSISAFCNAGFDILGADSLEKYTGDYVVCITIMTLIIISGLGFIVWIEIVQLFKKIKHLKNKNKIILYINQLSLHAKIVLSYSFGLLFIGAIFFFIVEFKNTGTIGILTLPQKIMASFFQSVTLRTAGFAGVSQGNLTESSKFMSVLLMYVGGSPGGTAGGVKVTSFAVVTLAVLSVIRGKTSIEAFGKTISFNTLQKALAILMLNLFFIMTASMLMSFFERDTVSLTGQTFNFLDYLFETTSAVSTVGVTTGITPYITNASKIVLVICMYSGRVGTVTLLAALQAKTYKNQDVLKYPEEKILIG